MTDLKHKTAALLDDDAEGQGGFEKIAQYGRAIDRHGKIKCFVVGKNNGNDEIRRLKQSGIVVPLAIDELCGKQAWDHAQAKGWLLERGSELIEANVKHLTKAKTLTEVVAGKLTDTHARRLVEYKLEPTKKGAFGRHVAQEIQSGKPLPESLRVLAEQIRDYFAS